MSQQLLVPLLLVLGLLVWVLSSNAKVSEAGKLTFFAALIGLCVANAHHL